MILIVLKMWHNFKLILLY